jgi:hypothetical protein
LTVLEGDGESELARRSFYLTFLGTFVFSFKGIWRGNLCRVGEASRTQIRDVEKMERVMIKVKGFVWTKDIFRWEL